FNHNSGEVMLTSTSNQTFATNGATFNDLTINDGLIGYWKLDESSSPAIDYSGYGNNLSWQNSATSSTTVPTAVAFTDSRSFSAAGSTRDAALTSIPSTVQVSFPITLSAWYSATTTDTSGGEILSAADSYTLRLTPTGVACLKYIGSTTWVVLSATPAGALNGNWHHLACVMTTSGMTLYFDGTSVNSNTDTSAVVYPVSGSTLNLAVGRHGGSSTAYDFTGKIDEVRIYNRALSATQVGALAAGYQPGTGSATQTMTGAPTVSGDLVIASGTLSAGSNALTVGGDWWNYGGMFIGTGTVAFNGTGTGSMIRSAGQDFGAVTVSGTGKWTLDDRLSVAGGALAVSAGTLDASGYTVRAGSISTGGTFTATGSTVVVDGTANSTLPALSAGALRVEDPSESNLVAYWKLDNAQGTTFRDYSGSGNTGTLFPGASWVTSSLPSIGYDDPAAVSLDGSSGYATMGAANLPAINGNITISFWAYWPSIASSPTTGQNMVVLDSSGTHLQIGLWHDQTLGAWNNGGTNMLSASSTPASGWHHIAYTFDGTTRKLYLDGGTPATSTTATSSGATTTVYLGTYNGTNELLNGKLDDIRIYNTPLNAAQVASLAAGRYPGTGGTSTVTLGGTVTLDGALALDSGSLSTSTFNLTAANTTSTLATVSAGTLAVGSGTVSLKGGATFQSTGTLTMATSGGTLAMGSGTTLTIDGTLNASSTGATIKSVSGTYTFTVGSTASATPTLNISGLAVKNTSGGMAIGATTAALPVFTKFDNIAFSNGSGSQLLSIKAASLYLSASGCTFDAGVAATTSKSVFLAGNGTSDGETRVVFGGATCASNAASCQATKNDDDSGNDGIGDTPASNGAVVQFVRSVGDDSAGSVIGFPTAAFDWNTFTYYSTYVAFHNASGSNTDAVYVRDESGNPLYSWTVPTASETITGTPQWTTISSKHYLFVATDAGKVYRLVDTATGTTSGTLSLDTGTAWTTNPFNCSCAISTPLAMDANNVYWGSTTSGKNFWTVGISNESNPTPLAIPPAVTNTALTITTVSSTSYAFMGVTGNMLKISTAGNSITATNSSPGAASVKGCIVVGYNKSGLQRVYAGDDAGTMWALDPGSGFATANGLWKYASGSAINGSP
ncbi:MAG: LamG domain-containing protein, partial [Verrucomicrobiota bacterium]